MGMENFIQLTDKQKLKVLILNDSKKISKEVASSLNIEIDENCFELIGEIVWKKLEMYATDLEAFAKHGKRVNINVQDVKLLVRRNPNLKEHINKLSDEFVNNKDRTKKSKKAKTSK